MHRQLIGVYQPCQKALARSKCLSLHPFLATLNVRTFTMGIAVSSNAFIRLAPRPCGLKFPQSWLVRNPSNSGRRERGWLVTGTCGMLR